MCFVGTVKLVVSHSSEHARFAAWLRREAPSWGGARRSHAGGAAAEVAGDGVAQAAVGADDADGAVGRRATRSGLAGEAGE